ncbi:MAG: pilus assembly protein [Gammaproteobacteria bacterium]|nr:pilus assembly protein [Gammaproteobacteria bacterium]MDH5275066.1 pilus assembly protein [Gammaproteobacteria bacterium]
MMHRKPNRSAQRGVAVVEFAIALPLLMFLFLAVSEIGRAFLHYNSLTRAVRDSARLVSTRALSGQSGTVSLDAAVVASARNLVAYGNPQGTGPALLPGLAPGNVTVRDAGNNNIAVSVTYNYQPMIGTALPNLLGGGSIATTFTLSAEVIMRAIS